MNSNTMRDMGQLYVRAIVGAPSVEENDIGQFGLQTVKLSFLF